MTLSSKKFQWTLAILAVLIYITFYFPVPYFIATPGQATELDTIIEVEDGYKESGELMLTSVSIYKGSLFTIIYSKFNSFMETIPKELILGEDEDQEDYTNRQIQVMEESQGDALIAAFSYLGLPIDVLNNGVLVMGILPGVPSEDVLEIGDLIIAIDDKRVTKLDDMLNYFKSKYEDDVVKIDFIRDKKEYSAKIPLVSLYSDSEKDFANGKVGLGIYPYENRSINSLKAVEFKTEEIGGPSAGLMFALEIINQLVPEDLTKGYKIAGTGTISIDGNVGQIGSPRLKVKAAIDEGAEIFFVPKDINDTDTNEKEALQSNEDLGKPIDIVPVSNVGEAIEYLRQLEVK
ncbi:MAG: SepM family pheromone-processing serine protease [Vulcanibacillus sp.]